MSDEPSLSLLRLVIPDGGNHKGTSTCQHEGCGKTTREGKPFCSAHVEDSPYVRSILAILCERDEEEAILNKKNGGIQTQGFFFRETLLLLRSKDYTAKALSRRLDISHHAAERLIVLMTKGGLAKRGMTSRGDTTISGLGLRDLVEE